MAGSKTIAGTIESNAEPPESGDEGIDAAPGSGNGSRPANQPTKGGKTSRPASGTMKPPGKNTSTTSGKGPRIKYVPEGRKSTRVLARGSHYRILELKKMLESVRNLARVEEDPALDHLLDLLREAYSAMHEIAPDPLSPDNPQSPWSPA